MYTEERSKWWAGRSVTNGYQKAYERLASQVPRHFAGTIIDVACGTGDLIPKILNVTRKARIVGTDASEAALQEARRRLRGKGIMARICDADNLSKEEGEVSLVKDDIMESTLPSDLSDITFFNFPETGVDYKKDPERNYRLLEKFRGVFGALPHPEIFDEAMAGLRVYENLARITKSGKRIIMARYDLSEGEDSKWDKNRLISIGATTWVLGIMVVNGFFYKSSEVYSDTDKNINTPTNGRAEGYRIVIAVKT